MKQRIIAQGAEAIIYLDKDLITKKRVKKSYRIPEVDSKIRKLRTRGEARLIRRASKVISVPKILKEDEKTKEIKMEFIDGQKLSEHLNKYTLEEQKKICEKIGESVSKMHEANIVHGDLTTSNMILKQDKIYLIDFGLSFYSHKMEDKAVDIYLLKQALEAKHFEHFQSLFNSFLKTYEKNKESKEIMRRFEKVERRRRYKN